MQWQMVVYRFCSRELKLEVRATCQPYRNMLHPNNPDGVLAPALKHMLNRGKGSRRRSA